MEFWKKGEKKALAEAAGVSPAYLSDVIHRRRRVSFRRANGLADAANRIGKFIPWTYWLAENVDLETGELKHGT